MIDLHFRPIDRPIAPPKGGAKRAQFKAGFTRTLDDLERELKHLRARDIIVEAALDIADIRNDGWPRSTARPRTPGIRLSFTSAHGPLSYECATYLAWEDNLRAIGLTLESLRAVDRYGAVKGGEQYKGWARLPQQAGGDGVDAAARTLIDLAGPDGAMFTVAAVIGTRDVCTRVRKLAMMRCHPDVNHNAPDAAEKTQRAQKAYETIVAAMSAQWARAGA